MTITTILTLCKMEGIETNRAKKCRCEKGVEGIKYLEEFKPIEHLFEGI